MNHFWLKIRVWTKVAAFALVFLYGLLFVAYNSDEYPNVWLFPWVNRQTNLFLVMLISFLIGVTATLLLRQTFKTIGQIRELRERTRITRMEQELEQQRSQQGKAARLQTRPDTTENLE